jgi:hypothetical protein
VSLEQLLESFATASATGDYCFILIYRFFAHNSVFPGLTGGLLRNTCGPVIGDEKQLYTLQTWEGTEVRLRLRAMETSIFRNS